MGMEGFNAVPEPVVPDESQRVEDVEKAQVMADAEDGARIAASKNRKIATGEEGASVGSWYNPNHFKTQQDARDFHAEKADNLGKIADEAGERAGEEFDKTKEGTENKE